MRFIVAYLVVFVACTGLAIYTSNVMADRLTDNFATAYSLGTVEPSTIATDRTIVFDKIKEHPERTTAFYRTNVTINGEQKDTYGVMELTPYGGYTYRGIHQAKYDLAIAGQLADVGTTAVALIDGGFEEANPLGFAILPVKYGIHKYSETLPLADCVTVRTGLGVVGWGAAAMNVATLASAALPGAMLVGIIGGWLAYEPTKLDAPVRCV